MDDAAARLLRELTETAASHVRLRVRPYDSGARLPCAADRPCVVVTGETVAPRGGLERRQPLLVVAPAGIAAQGRVTVDDVRVEPVQVDERATAAVTLSAPGLTGRETRIEIRDGEVPVGDFQHAWTGASPVTVTVPWWPARAGRRRLSVTATTPGAEGGAPQHERVTVAVEVSATPWPVLVVEARPSWAVTFVRRALEADPRLDVDAVTVLAPGLAASRSGDASRGRAAGVTDARVERARVVVVGGLDALSAGEVARFERFVTTRGGALVLVPDAVVTGPATRLMPGRWQRRLDPAPSPATALHPDHAGPALRASEWLLAADLAAGDAVLAGHDGSPAIVARAFGEGRIVVVGALDAWRFRTPAVPEPGMNGTPAGGGTAGPDDVTPGATPFAQAWHGLVADLARGTGPQVEVRVSHEAGDADAVVDVQARALAPRATWSASARVMCGAGDGPLRLWPQARAGHFRGHVPLPAAGTECAVVAAVAGLGEGQATLAAPLATRGEAGRVAARLRAVATASGGLAAAPSDVGAVAQALAALAPAGPVPATNWPMRSWWWGLAVALALGAEWWQRRASGAR